jgi:hypothetical protein
MFLPVQLAAVKALENSKEWHQQMNSIYGERREHAAKVLELLDCNYSDDQTGMFLWAKIPDTIGDVEEFIDELLYEARVFITPGKIFGSNGERFIRISLCMDKAVIVEAYGRIERMLVEKTQKS